MAGHFYLIFNLPGQIKQYFRREAEQLVTGRAVIVPEITTDVRQAHRFNPESAVAFRDCYREQYKRENVEIFIEDTQGIKKFEREAQAASPTEDCRKEVLVEPDGFENTGLGFLVRPAIRPEGYCWCIRASDVPSLAGRASAIETVYGPDPISTVDRMLATWGSLAKPSPAPWAAQQDTANAEQILKEFQQSQKSPGRLRPGDRS